MGEISAHSARVFGIKNFEEFSLFVDFNLKHWDVDTAA
ncbi:hypothetical protein CCACVL1_30195 [Corchorus capsularis]|uniref:Uncharacterized protein n=1 Tax=Corchorus capsularis TaxID=210143 RepID=A0A1R3FYF8_COCAP|nr:hypothetical protein CCACVL1_30195 [Corchorus capsularis]